jgi:hypothetical protein
MRNYLHLGTRVHHVAQNFTLTMQIKKRTSLPQANIRSSLSAYTPGGKVGLKTGNQIENQIDIACQISFSNHKFQIRII